MQDAFVRNIIAFKGEAGRKWLDRIPELIKQYEKKWSLTAHDPFILSYNYVAPATTDDGKHVVLKIGYPQESDFWAELRALRIFNGHGCCALLDVDQNQHVMLLERVEPGVPVSSLADDDQATRILISVMQKLWHKAPLDHQFPTLEDRFAGFTRLRKTFNGKTGPLPEAIVTEGEELFRHLLDTSTESYVLHSDLHHDNVLSSDREGYLAIDPHGVVGERVHETAAMLRNPQQKLHSFDNPKKVLSRRIAILSEELGFAKERIRQWGVAQTVLSAIWKLEDGGTDWNYCITTAEWLSSLNM